MRAGFEHEDLVGVDHGRKAVRDDQRRAVPRDFGEARLDLALGLRVERRGRLVEDQDLRGLQNDPRDRDALLLAAREFEAALADDRVVSVRQRRDKVVNARVAGGLLDLGAAGAGPSVGDVVEDRVVEQHRILRHDPDRAAQTVLRDIPDVLAVDLDRAGLRIVEAEQQPRDRRFAGAARPDDREFRPRRHREIDIAQDGAARIVAEIDMAEANRAVRHRERRRAGPVLDFGRDLHQRHHLLEVGQRLLDVAVDDAEEIERRVELQQVGIDQHEIADRHPACRDTPSPPASSPRSARRR